MSNKKSSKSKKTPVYSNDVMALQLVGGFVLIALGVLIALAVLVQMQGDIFFGLRSVCYGMAGSLAPLLAIFPIWGGVLLLMSTQVQVPVKPFGLAFLIFMLVLACTTLFTSTGSRNNPQPLLDFFYNQNLAMRSYGAFLQKAYAFSSAEATMGSAGGWMGMVFAWPLWSLMSSIPAGIVCILGIIIAALVLFRFKPKKFIAYLRSRKPAEEAVVPEEQPPIRVKAQPGPPARPDTAANAQAGQWARFMPPAAEDGVSNRRGYGPQQYDRMDAQPSAETPVQTTAPQKPARSRRTPPKPTQYGFPPTEEENRTIPQPLEEQPKPRRSRILGTTTEATEPVQQKRRDLFGRRTEKKPSGATTPQPPVSQEPPMQDGQPVQPWQSRTAPTPRINRAATAPTPAVNRAASTPAANRSAAAKQPSVADFDDQPTARSADSVRKPAKQQPKPSWYEDDDIPPWEDKPTPVAPEDVRVPVVQSTSGWEPELDLAPAKAGVSTYGDKAEEEQLQLEIPYVYPGLDLLAEPVQQTGISPEEDAMRAQRLEETLDSFKVQASVRHITHGPAISRFELELAPGINVNRVTNLGANIAMNMEVKSVRIEAPIPGKSLVGIEVPNRKVSTVTLREVMESEAMAKAKSPLVVALGKDIAGTPIVCDLARMPHLLIAGATGSGKSVCINTMINSLLYRCSPKEVRMILVDPKVVELQCYNGIPHLLIPVVSDPHKAAGALAWAVAEMMDRYKKFQVKGVRAIDGYNAAIDDERDFMPRIVIIIDELADLMMTCKRDVEDHICRLAQLARAAGIHLVVATQRPSVDVITGLIKANIPSRIAFKVSSFIDSRTILDKNGAEQLLGWGDMLYQPTGEFTPIRIQGCFLSDDEVNDITDFIRSTCPSSYDPSVIEQLDQLEREASGSALPDPAEQEADLTGDGSLLEQAIEMAVRDGQVSTSVIQRRLKVGYARAGRLVDEMEKRGIVSQKDGAKPRMCLISPEEFEQMRGSLGLDD